jgi:hypothetical protein
MNTGFYRSRRDTPSKVEQIETTNIADAMRLAKADPRVKDVLDGACWIMDRSAYWRSLGTEVIIKQVQDAVALYNKTIGGK